jgi:hypothetical protein
MQVSQSVTNQWWATLVYEISETCQVNTDGPELVAAKLGRDGIASDQSSQCHLPCYDYTQEIVQSKDFLRMPSLLELCHPG